MKLMKYIQNKNVIVLLTLLFVGITTLAFISSRFRSTTLTRTNALQSTTLSFVPTTTQSAPLQKNINDTVTFDLMVTPGQNFVSLTRLEILYDSTTLQPITPALVQNTDAFPTTLDPVSMTPGRITATFTIGTDPTKAITVVTKVATITFKAIKDTPIGQPTRIAFGPATEVLSAGPNDQAAENVLNQALPAFVQIAPLPTAVPTLTPVPTALPTLTPTRTPTPTVTPTPLPTATPIPSAIKLNFKLYLHGIGNSGDNANPLAYSLSNKNPIHTQRSIAIQIVDSQQVTVATESGTVTYDQTNGNFTGTVAVNTIIPTGDYIIKITSPGFLRKYIPGILTLSPGESYDLTTVTLVNGDADYNNALNILDYNMLRDCYNDFSPAIACDPAKKLKTDFTDNDKVNQYDYNLLLREISVQNGD